MNIPNEYHIGYIKLPLQRRHWIAIRKIGDNFYNLDSKLKEPLCIGQVIIPKFNFLVCFNTFNIYILFQDADLITYLNQKLSHKDNQLFVVVTADTKDWQNEVNVSAAGPSSTEKENG